MMRGLMVCFAALLSVRGAFAVPGFYRVAKEPDGRWWCYTPWNAHFVPMGVDHVNSWGFVGANSKWDYKENVQAKYGSVKAWGEETLKRLKDWNFNLLGANSDPEIRYCGVLPYTIFIGLGQSFAGRGGECAIVWKGGCFPNVFNPDFEKTVGRQARNFCRANPKNTMLFGYFIDNELAWRGVGAPTTPGGPPGNRATGLYDAVEALPETHSAKRALTAFVGDRKVTNAVKTEFLGQIAERYFKATCEAIRAVDPNHLVLGARFAGWEGAHEVVWRAAGRHCDVVSVNLYPHVDPEMGKLTDWNGERQIPFREVLDPLQACAGRPVMVTEWSFPALDAGHPCTRGGGQMQPTQQARTKASETCLRTFLATPYIIGHSFFAWPDQSPDAPGENCNYGLVNLKSEPYRELTEMFTRLQADPIVLRDALKCGE